MHPELFFQIHIPLANSRMLWNLHNKINTDKSNGQNLVPTVHLLIQILDVYQKQ